MALRDILRNYSQPGPVEPGEILVLLRFNLAAYPFVKEVFKETDNTVVTRQQLGQIFGGITDTKQGNVWMIRPRWVAPSVTTFRESNQRGPESKRHHWDGLLQLLSLWCSPTKILSGT